MCSSITIFVKRNKFMFNENLGSGSKYGSCEDVDYIYNLLLSGKRIFYNPEIKVWHPEINNKNISLIRVESYAAGLGYFISYKKSLIKFGLLLGCVFIKLFQFIFKNNDYNKGYFYNYFTGFIRGLVRR